MNLFPNRLISSLFRFRFVVAFAGLLLLLNGRWATAQTLPVRSGQEAATVATSVMKAMQWRLIGPFRGGRSVAVAGHPTERLKFYMSTTGGGVWKTENGGITWQNISDGFFKMGSVGAIAVAKSNPDIIYVGMGEHTLRGNLAPGDGVYKSTDGGKTWTHVGLTDTQHIGSVLIDPTNPDVVYVAAIGHAFGPNEERGVFRTQDGGKTWQKVLYKNPNVGAIDLTMDPANPKTIYASTFEFRRFPWGVRSAGPGAGIHKSTDGGNTWTDITLNKGLPTGTNRGRIGLALSPAKPDRVWAIIEAENEQTGVYRTDDGGVSWQLMSQFADLFQRPWYYHHLTADPKDPETLWVLNINMWKSGDGGKTYKRVETPHGDNHQLWIDSNDTKRMVQANDGGGTVSFDGGNSWSTIYNQPTAQMYHVVTDNRFPYRVYGAQQDNSTISVPSRSDYGAIYPHENYDVGGGESGYIAFNRNDPTLIFAANHHWLTRLNLKTNQLKDVSVIPDDMYGYGSADLAYRFQWTYPVIMSPHNPKVLYATSQYVHRSTDQGQSWQVISPNLSRSDPATLEKTPTMDDPSIGKDWGPIKRDNTGVEWYGTIFALAESPVKPGVLWAGSDDGYVQVSADNGKTWKNVTPKEMPSFARISIIDPSAHNPATAYVAALKYKQDDFHPYIYKTNDFGKTWTKITQGIPDDDYIRVVREDPKRRGLLYAGGEKGMYVSFNDGGRWQPLQLNLPRVPIHDLAIQDNDLIAATHGRSFWILDDLTTLHQLTDEVQKPAVHLFKPRPTIRFKADMDPAIKPVPNGSSDLGTNPPNGVKVVYYLAEKPKAPITLSFLDANGQLIKSYKSNIVPTPASTTAGVAKDSANLAEMRQPTASVQREPALPAQAGGNSFVWADMRYPDPIALPNSVTHGRARGPLAMPGTYTVQLTVDGKTYTQKFEIVKDPRIETTPEEFRQQFDLLIKIRERINELRNGVLSIRQMRQQLDSTYKSQDDQSVKELKDQLLRIEDALYQYRAKATQDLTNHPVRLHTKFTALAGFIESDDSKPTQQQGEQYNALSKSLAEQLKKLETVKAAVQRKLRPTG
ncbi:glycosyl hydrolase, BNR repeat-containing protein [Fibrisoma limi BUZ 3]|uniref:Glycosyl hydrolase, BNR repeat-containing protein n=1 Tax=Fibrisoma limi BUZ 3 TaxID=1185876 RepID=I2GK10_9BACT|nr:glycosyl hydrolase [Fibrisoma limi]CCH54235.1 glycosyl hydrolase, BNR repeat-containing protein [Fibrisoma limi BUZ 3]